MANKRIGLSKEAIDRNREFLKQLFSLDLIGQSSYFDKKPYGTARCYEDAAMNLERFLHNMRNPFVTLNTEFENIPGRNDITYRIGLVKLPGSKDERIARWSVPSNRENYAIVSKIFESIYERPIE